MSTANKSSNRWLALMSATLAFTFTFLSRFTWAPLMSTVMEEFSINATQAGLYMSAFFAGYCITQIPGGIMADKLQPKYILIIATLLGGIWGAIPGILKAYLNVNEVITDEVQFDFHYSPYISRQQESNIITLNDEGQGSFSAVHDSGYAGGTATCTGKVA